MKRILISFLLGVTLFGGLIVAGTITKPNTFTGQASPQLPWLDQNFDTIYSEFNGNIDDNNIKSNAAIAQSKITNLVTDLANRILKAGDTMTGALAVKFSTPYVRLIGTEGSAKDWRVAEDASDLKVQENTGTEGSPVWTTRYTLSDGAGGPATGTDLTTKTYVDAEIAAKILAIDIVAKMAADQTATQSNTTLQNVTSLVLALAASTSYACNVELLITGANATHDAKFGWTVPAAATMFWGPELRMPLTADNTVLYWSPANTNRSPDALLSDSDTLSIGTFAGTSGLKLTAIVRIAGTAGNLQFRFSQDTSHASDLKLLKDSRIVCRKIQ